MKKIILILAVFSFLLSCRDTEMNTDGNMEEQEKRQVDDEVEDVDAE